MRACHRFLMAGALPDYRMLDYRMTVRFLSVSAFATNYIGGATRRLERKELFLGGATTGL